MNPNVRYRIAHRIQLQYLIVKPLAFHQAKYDLVPEASVIEVRFLDFPISSLFSFSVS